MRDRFIHRLTSFSADRPWLVIGVTLAIIAVFGLQLPKMRSLRWGLLSFVPLLFTITVIYGMFGRHS